MEKSNSPVIGRPNPHQVHLQPLVRKNSIQNQSIGREIRSSVVEKMDIFTSQTNVKKLHLTVECILRSMAVLVAPEVLL